MNDSERLFERLGGYRNALARLRDALAKPQDEYMRDAVIQRFEFTYELAWKAIKLWLEFKNVDIHSPKDAFREALQLGLIDDGNGWSEMQRNRNLTSHTYNEQGAEKVAAFIREQGVHLLEALERRLTEETGMP